MTRPPPPPGHPEIAAALLAWLRAVDPDVVALPEYRGLAYGAPDVVVVGPDARHGYVVLCCYCRNPSRCHRTLAAQFLEKAAKGRARFDGECEPTGDLSRPEPVVIVCTRGPRGHRCDVGRAVTGE